MYIDFTVIYMDNQVIDKTLTPSLWTTLMDYPNGLPLKNSISDEWYVKKLQLYTYTAGRMLFFSFRIVFSCHFET